MNFICKEWFIDDSDFGCTIQFSDTKDQGYNENMTVDMIGKTIGKYFLLQKSYPEERYGNDFYMIETTESKTELGYLDSVIIKLERDRIIIQWSGDHVEIGLQLNEKELVRLRKIFKNRFKDKVIMIDD